MDIDTLELLHGLSLNFFLKNKWRWNLIGPSTCWRNLLDKYLISPKGNFLEFAYIHKSLTDMQFSFMKRNSESDITGKFKKLMRFQALSSFSLDSNWFFSAGCTTKAEKGEIYRIHSPCSSWSSASDGFQKGIHLAATDLSRTALTRETEGRWRKSW